MKRLVRVINKGSRVRERLGSRFLPNVEQKLYVNSREYLTLKAVRDFKVEVLEDNEKKEDKNKKKVNNKEQINNKVVTKDIKDEESDSNQAKIDDSSADLDYYDLNIEEVIKAVKDGIFDVDVAIAYEVAGKNRVTLLEKLEEMKKEQEEQK